MNVIISQFQSNFERVFCVEKFRGLQFRGCEKDIFGKKKQKTEQGKGKVQYVVTVRILRSTCKKIIYPTSQTLYPSYRSQTSLTYLPQIFVLHCQLALLS